ncbi:hypothetical protein [Candidatus Pelagibacter communis]|uniref:hypothetical protein n=1 Tax=Pelagibacter ubique TaxID=198252 RepID=UPI00094D119B|nr:hypothetical protein [Candidatus Pelagibacter ubique]
MIKFILAGLLASTAFVSTVNADFKEIGNFGTPANNPGAEETSAEIISATADGMKLVYSDSPANALGMIDITDPANPKPLGSMSLGGEPTSVAIKNGKAYVGINTSPDYVKPSGHLLVIDLASGKEVSKVQLGGQPDSVAVSPDGTFVAVAIENERNEDINDEKIPQLPGGFVAIVNLADNSVAKADLVGFSTIAPNDPEPEFVDINNLGEIVVTMQENNWMAVIDRNGNVISEFDAGLVTLVGIDNKKDGQLNMSDSIENVRREPDAVKWIGNDHFATANEGDYKHEAPGQAKRGGSRGWTIFNKDGSVVYESGSSYERALASAGYWPESRAEKKGVEPESVEVAIYGDTRYIFIGAERANAIGVYKANDLSNPELVTILPTGIGPEGLVAIPERNLFVSANEVDKEKSVTIYSLD